VTTAGVLGTWQEFIVADVWHVVGVPESLSTSTAAQLIITSPTARLLVTS
jgi:NADPH:quinone reductase-like Zn-dependent oxidoreductase